MNIILGITGSIAAYKAAMLTRLLVKNEHHVQVLMTGAAKGFITPLTLATVSGNRVRSEFFDTQKGIWENHVSLGIWADLLLIAPLSASSMSKMATGQSDNLLIATYLSARCPVCVAPAMDHDMYLHPSTRRNLKTLKDDGVKIIPAAHGELASGLVGEGRMAEPEAILDYVNQNFGKKA